MDTKNCWRFCSARFQKKYLSVIQNISKNSEPSHKTEKKKTHKRISFECWKSFFGLPFWNRYSNFWSDMENVFFGMFLALGFFPILMIFSNFFNNIQNFILVIQKLKHIVFGLKFSIQFHQIRCDLQQFKIQQNKVVYFVAFPFNKKKGVKKQQKKRKR